MLNKDKGIIEAALFVAGEPLDEERLSALLKGRPVKEAVQALIQDYKDRDSSIEIVELEGKYVMQVKAGYAEEVRDIAPRELPPPILRTLSMIAYHQPLTQSYLVGIRGNSAYSHVRELEERGLISVAPKGRTKLLQTTGGFSEYFGLESQEPSSIRQKIAELAIQQKVGLDRWLGKKTIGVSPMYQSLLTLCGIEDYRMVNPYNPGEEELNGIDVLIIARGYAEKVRKYFDGKIIEVSSSTFGDLIDSLGKLSEYGDETKIKASIEHINELKESYVSKTLTFKTKVKPATEMAARIARDLRLGISTSGVVIAPDYERTSSGAEINGEIIIPTHGNAASDIIERVSKRYEAVIEGLKRVEESTA